MKFKKLTPNLIVGDVNAAADFYQDILGFTKTVSVPDEGPLAFAIMNSGGVTIMLQSQKSYEEENPVFRDTPVGGTFVLYIDVEDIDGLHDRIKDRVEVIVEMHATFYGTREFAIRDLNGYVVQFAEEMKNSE